MGETAFMITVCQLNRTYSLWVIEAMDSAIVNQSYFEFLSMLDPLTAIKKKY
jgi:hypothetical protein